MKPFDLEAAKRGEPMCTRDGRRVIKFVDLTDVDTGDLCYLYYAKNDDDGLLHSWVTKTGKASLHEFDDNDDLFMLPQTKKLYIGIRDNGNHSTYLTTCAYKNIDECKNIVESDYQSEYWTIKEIEIEV